jgi:hypothetical protein
MASKNSKASASGALVSTAPGANAIKIERLKNEMRDLINSFYN